MTFKKDDKSLIDLIEHLSSGVSVVRDNLAPAEPQPAEPQPAEQQAAAQQPAEQQSESASAQTVPARPQPDSEPSADR